MRNYFRLVVVIYAIVIAVAVGFFIAGTKYLARCWSSVPEKTEVKIDPQERERRARLAELREEISAARDEKFALEKSLKRLLSESESGVLPFAGTEETPEQTQLRLDAYGKEKAKFAAKKKSAEAQLKERRSRIRSVEKKVAEAEATEAFRERVFDYRDAVRREYAGTPVFRRAAVEKKLSVAERQCMQIEENARQLERLRSRMQKERAREREISDRIDACTFEIEICENAEKMTREISEIAEKIKNLEAEISKIENANAEKNNAEDSHENDIK